MRHIERNSLLLFMIPADSDDIRKEYAILHTELVQYNPELLDKRRVLAITKCDMLDDELMAEMEQELPEGVPHVFISSVAQMGLTELKDLLWKELNQETFHEVERIVHKNLDLNEIPMDDDDYDYVVPVEEEEEELDEDEVYESYYDEDEESDEDQER